MKTSLKRRRRTWHAIPCNAEEREVEAASDALLHREIRVQEKITRNPSSSKEKMDNEGLAGPPISSHPSISYVRSFLLFLLFF